MDMKEKFLEEYRGSFGELDQPLDDLGWELIGINVSKNGDTEYIEITGTGYRWDRYLKGMGMSRIETSLNRVNNKYNTEWQIVRMKS